MEKQQNVSETDFLQLFKLATKYILEGIAVGLAMYLIGGRRLAISEIVVVGLTASLTFLFLDVFAPSIGDSARVGSGFGLGYQTVSGFVGSTMPLIATSDKAIIPNKTNMSPIKEGFDSNITELINNTECCKSAGSPYKVGCGDTLSHYNRNCKCIYSTCESCCKPGDKCKVTCKDNGCIGCFKPDNISDNNCAYKIIPGQYSARAVLPGYNECVKPFNQGEGE